jgi:mRNA interferase MazF
MPFTIPYKRGDIVLVPFPFTDLTNTKQRPALVVSSDILNGQRDDVLVAGITSQVPASLASDEFNIPLTDLSACGLPKASMVRLSKLVTLHRRLIIKRIGTLPSASVEQALAQLRQLF